MTSSPFPAASAAVRAELPQVHHPREAALDGLQNRYRDLIIRLGGNAADAATAFAAVHAAWSADTRVYHGVEHLLDCLRELDSADVGARSAELVELALWYHDLVYDPRAHDNEERSAQALLADAATLDLPSGVATAAAALVRATAHTEAAAGPVTPEAALIADIDLSIFGRDPARFMAFEFGVEKEYAHVPKRWFRCGRGRFLAALLRRPHLFRTEAFRARYERPARRQIAELLVGPRYRAYRWLRWLR